MGKKYQKRSFLLPTLWKGVRRTTVKPRTRKTSGAIKPDDTVTQHNVSLTHVNLNSAKREEILSDLLGARQEYLVYNDVSLDDYLYITDRLESDAYKKTCKSLKLSFFSDFRRLMAFSPSAAHESVLNRVMNDLGIILDTIPIPSDIAYCQVCPNIGYRSASIRAVPDLTIKMLSNRPESHYLSRTIWMMESAFSQNDGDVMYKLRAYTESNPHLLVVGKIVINQTTQWSSPGSIKSIAKKLRSSKLMTEEEWPGIHGDAKKYSEVLVDHYSWFSLSSVELHVWTRKSGATKIDVDCRDDDGYAFGTLYPKVDLDKVDDAFRRGLELTQAAILALDVPGMDHSSMQNWTLPARIINLNRCIRALADGAWATSYSRYYDWHEQQRKAHNSSPSIQTTRTRAPRRRSRRK